MSTPKTPITDALKEHLKDPQNARHFAESANALATLLQLSERANPEIAHAEEITYSDFQKIDLRIGKVLQADRVPKSTKLLRMLVSFGAFQRQILAGVGETFEPTALVGKQFMFVVNLAPRKMMGLESHGMLLATGPDSTALSLVSPLLGADGQEVIEGSKVG